MIYINDLEIKRTSDQPICHLNESEKRSKQILSKKSK